MNLVDELHTIAAALEAEGIPYAVCGGIAVTIHGAIRTTKDIDLLVAAADVPRIVVSRATLVRMKRLAGRPQDLDDLEKLEAAGG